MLSYWQVKDSSGDDVRNNVRVNDSEEHDIPNSRGTAHFALKWAKDSRKVSYLHVVNVKGVTRAVTGMFLTSLFTIAHSTG